MITRSQVRMARAALGWSVRDLGKHAGIAANTVSRFENGMGTNLTTLKQIQWALEEAEIIFIGEDSVDGPGIRLREPRADD
jgi:transcriptional regulator with XRE-family HTH domain